MGVRHRPATRCSPEPETMAPVVMTNGEPDMRRTFHEQLEDLKADVIRLGGMTVELISGATLALLDSDLTVTQQTIHNDEPIDELTHDIDDTCFSLLARQQPMATDLRTILATLRISHELERSADLMVNVAKTTRRLGYVSAGASLLGGAANAYGIYYGGRAGKPVTANTSGGGPGQEP